MDLYEFNYQIYVFLRSSLRDVSTSVEGVRSIWSSGLKASAVHLLTLHFGQTMRATFQSGVRSPVLSRCYGSVAVMGVTGGIMRWNLTRTRDRNYGTSLATKWHDLLCFASSWYPETQDNLVSWLGVLICKLGGCFLCMDRDLWDIIYIILIWYW